MAAALRSAALLDRGRIQERARKRFSSDRMAAEYLAVYAEAIAGRSPPVAAGEGGWTTLAQ